MKLTGTGASGAGTFTKGHFKTQNEIQAKVSKNDLKLYLDSQFLWEHIHHVRRRRFVRPLNLTKFKSLKVTISFESLAGMGH